MPRRHAALVAVLAAAAPVFALLTERLGGLAPCALCLWQRWPYWAAAALALLAAATGRRWWLALAGVAVLGSAGLGGLHAGVERGWWPSPLPACAAPAATSGSVDDLLRSLAPRPSKPCDAPTFLLPGLPVSMAEMNLLYALGLAALALLWSRRRPDDARAPVLGS